MNRFDIERALLASDLSAQARLVALVLLSLSDATTSVIPADYTPSLSRLVKLTALSRSTVQRALNELEEGGWVIRKRPDIQKARAEHERTLYRLLAPGMVQTEPCQVHTEPRARSTQNLGLGPDRTTSHTAFQTSNQQQEASPEKIVSEATGATPEEAEAIVQRIRTERQPKNLVGFLRHLAKEGDLKQFLAEARAGRAHADDAADRKIRQGMPRCDHGHAGGNQPHSITGELRCRDCRKASNVVQLDSRRAS